jgi:ABC-type transport system substrate-binding protein/class 3 adenylate cyclase
MPRVGAGARLWESRPRHAMSPSRPSGIATVMFTDLEASTEMTTRLGDDAAASLFAQHDRIVRDAIAAHAGREVRSTGDGFLVRFDSARGGVACALSIQRELAARDDGLRVRIGIGAGEVQEGEAELFGAAINLAARVMDRADGGQVLVTDAVRQLVGTMPGARFRDRGRVALKGFPERQHLHEVLPAAGLPTRRAPRRSSRRPVIAAAALTIVAIAVALALLTTGGAETVDVSPNSVAIVDPDDGRVVGQVPVGVRPGALAVGAGSVWVANLGDDSVTQIGARSRRVVGTVSPGIRIDGLAVGPSGVWVADNARSTARMIDPAFRSVARAVRVQGNSEPGAPRPVAVSAGAVWMASGTGLARIDPDDGHTIAKPLVGTEPNGIAVGAGGVWVSDGVDGTLTRIDPDTNEAVATIGVGPSASGVAAGAGGVWVPVPLEDRVKRIDPATNAIKDSVPVAGAPGAVAIGAGAVWVTSRRGGTVTRIDPGSARVSQTVRLGHSLQGIAVTEGAVWVAVQARPPEARAVSAGGAPDVLTVLRPEGQPLQSMDPASSGGDQVHGATCAMLLNYPDQPFPAGAQLRPEVAAAMPTVTDSGRTYTFRLRSDFRFSPPSNAPVTADAFGRAIERATNPRSLPWVAEGLLDIVGASAYNAGRATQIAGVTARGDTLTIRLTAPSATLPARMATLLTCAVPPTTPFSGPGTERIPMAGPYYIASYAPQRRLLLRRNPNYHGPRHARMREIDINLDVTTARALAAVESGRADYVSRVPVDRVAELDRRYGPESDAGRAGHQRYFSTPLASLHSFVMNSHRPLFAGTRMRRALNLALDRRALARVVLQGPLGGPGRPTDQFIPPGLPGFHDVAIYPLGGPDVEQARRLAGNRRRHAVLYTCIVPVCVEQGREIRRNLAAIGVDVEVKNFPWTEMVRRILRPGEPWDISYWGWGVWIADPSDFVAPVYADRVVSGSWPGDFSDKALGRRLRAAQRITDATARARAFAQLDAAFARAGAAAPFATGVTTDFFSDRIGCQVPQPLYGISLGSLCVRR